jgi:hypothetical protein
MYIFHTQSSLANSILTVMSSVDIDLVRSTQPQFSDPNLPPETPHPHRRLGPELKVPGSTRHVQDSANQPQSSPNAQRPDNAVSGGQGRINPPQVSRPPLRHGLQKEPDGDNKEAYGSHEQGRGLPLQRRTTGKDC